LSATEKNRVLRELAETANRLAGSGEGRAEVVKKWISDDGHSAYVIVRSPNGEKVTIRYAIKGK
jgi:hypothetical protein